MTTTTRARSRMRKNPPPAKGARSRRRSHVAMIGTPRIVAALREQLDALGIESVVSGTPEELIERTNHATKAVLVAPPIPDESVAQLCRGLASASPSLPVFTVMRATLPWESEKRLYEAGVTAVFLWPKEREPLLQALIGLVHVGRRAAAREPRDAALRLQVRSQIKSSVELEGCALDIQVVRGVVLLGGTVEHLWQAESAANIARSVPGVQFVASDALRVQASGASDKEIATAIRKLIRATSSLDLSTLALDVTDGNVVLAGTVDSALELDRARALIRQIRGTKSLKTFVSVAPKSRKGDQRLAHQVERALALRYPKERIRVAAFGGIAVLRGAVRLAETREALETLVAVQPGVERIVNKLTVRRPSRRKDPG